MLGSRTPSRPAGRRPAHRTSRRSRARRTGLAGALAALALSIPVATGVGPVPDRVADRVTPAARAQVQLGPLGDYLRDLDPTGENGPTPGVENVTALEPREEQSS